MIPHPPKLTPEMPDLERATLMLRAYMGAVKARTGKHPWVFGRHPFRDLASSKHYRTLLAGASALMAMDVAPAAWAVFSVDVWLRYETSKKPPPPKWMFLPSRIEERHGWFEGDCGNALGGRVVFGEKAQVLVKRYTAAREQVMLTGDVARAVARWFPGDSYSQMVSEVQKEALEVQAHINWRVERGDWLW
jgi:hypothetical protein